MSAFRARQTQPISIQTKMRRLVVAFAISAGLILLAVLGMLMAHNSNYSGLLYNVTTASKFNQDFKETIDLKMYYYVIESQYSDGLPIDEVKNAQVLAQNLLNTTTEKESRLAISSVLDLCRNLEEKIYQIQSDTSYDDRQEQLENNVYVLTALIEEYMYNYLYHEAVHLDALQKENSVRIISEIVVIFLLAACLVLLLTQYISRLSRSITQPIADLCARVEEISAGDLSVKTPVESGEYEIRTLSEGMEQMTQRLATQIQENNRKQDTLRRTELALLQAQINPHFLYNTMDTIIWLIEADKPQEAMDMVSNLSMFFRHSLSRGEDVITLQEEEKHVRSYLQIQQVRYKDIMEYTINIDPSLHAVRIPKLTLQPLVENALYHGIKMKRGMGHIYVIGRAEGDHVLLQVTDDGVGMSPQRLGQLRQAMEGGERVGFGFSTVHERLRLFFGEGYGLSLSSQENVGTTVTVRIPGAGHAEEGLT
jgi:two-component system sensor histidine kinase YesM